MATLLGLTARENDDGEKKMEEKGAGEKGGLILYDAFRIAAQILGREICFGPGKLTEQRETPFLSHLSG